MLKVWLPSPKSQLRHTCDPNTQDVKAEGPRKSSRSSTELEDNLDPTERKKGIRNGMGARMQKKRPAMSQIPTAAPTVVSTTVQEAAMVTVRSVVFTLSSGLRRLIACPWDLLSSSALGFQQVRNLMEPQFLHQLKVLLTSGLQGHDLERVVES